MNDVLSMVDNVDSDAKVGVERGETLYYDRGYPVVVRPERSCLVTSRDAMASAGCEMVRVHARAGIAMKVMVAADDRDLSVRCWPVGPDTYVEITSGWAAKVRALQMLAIHLGLARTEVAMIGDGLSDAAALDWAGRGVAITGGDPVAVSAADTVASDFGQALEVAIR